ncbi:glycosyltransferase [Mastigocoleus testarum]|uniref:glycosyltransferase n=1 Tax=Mastigocoleus testarum TaxID=996925 RepID=UPI00041EEE78|nr:glycosyltransferase [Mastigocoleus testarum]
MIASTSNTDADKFAATAKDKSCLRVLFVSHTYVVGINQGKLDAIASQNEVEVSLLAPKYWKAVQWDKILEIENPYPRIQLYPNRVLFSGKAGAYLYSPLAIFRAILDFRPDIIQVEQEVFSLSGFEVALCSRLLNKPVVFFGWENMDRKLSWFRRWIRKFILNTTKSIIAGNCEGAELVKRWGYCGAVEVMPQMGVDTQLFTPRRDRLDYSKANNSKLKNPKLDSLVREDSNRNDSQAKTSQRKKSSKKNSKFCIGFLGRISYHKGIDILIDAARLLGDEDYEFQIRLCGTGSDKPKFVEQVQKLGLDKFIIWQDGVRHDEVPMEICRFDVLVLPSRTVETWKEQFGHVLIEAMATGIPVVGSTCGEIPNVIGRKDLVFPEGNAQELAAILMRLISQPSWYAEVADYSLERVRQHYSHERIAQRLIELWRNVLSCDGKNDDHNDDNSKPTEHVREDFYERSLPSTSSSISKGYFPNIPYTI